MLNPERDEQLEQPAEKPRESHSATVRDAVDLRADRHESPPLAPVESSAAHSRLTPSRRQWTRWTLFALLPIAMIAGAYWYVTGGQVMSTDDAYIEADKVGISTDVSGIVQDVAVRDNQHVTAGQVLYRLDPRQFQIALDNAKANLAETALSINAMKQDYKRMLSDAAAEQAQLDLDQINYDRQSALLRSGTASQAMFDQAHHTLLDDKSKLEALQQQAATQLARLGGNADIETTQHPQYLQAKAQVDEAQRELDHTG